jgi:hypothetical protein
MEIELLESLWSRISAISAESLRMTEEETVRFRTNRVARLIGLLPFVAGCDDATRTALSHLATFVIANRGQARHIFDHAPADDADVLARLRTIADFEGGDRAMIDRGMALLGRCMTGGYVRDAEADRMLGEYNPIVTRVWDATKVQAQYASILDEAEISSLDAIMKPHETSGIFWGT